MRGGKREVAQRLCVVCEHAAAHRLVGIVVVAMWRAMWHAAGACLGKISFQPFSWSGHDGKKGERGKGKGERGRYVHTSVV